MKNLHPYVPGEQPHDRQYIKLNANESPYPPSPAVIAAVREFVRAKPEALARYPDPDSSGLRAAIADSLNRTGGELAHAAGGAAERRLSVTPDMIYCGNGSDEVLSCLFYALFDADRPVVTPEFSYGFYPVYAGFYGVRLDTVPLKADWSLDVAEMTRRARVQEAPLLLANPNAPSGRGLSREELSALAEAAPRSQVIVIDEAYVDFGGTSALPLLAEYENVAVVRTFSKSMCGAGMRLGYLVANPPLIRAVTTVKNAVNHFPVDAVTQVAGIAACRADAYYADCAQRIAAARADFTAFLRARGWEVVPSEANFVFTKKAGLTGEAAYRALKAAGILVRHFAVPGMEDYVRITVGSEAEMAAVERALETL